MTRRQKGKGNKRPRAWHHGRAAGRDGGRALAALPDLATGADPTAGAPVPLRTKGNRSGPRAARGRCSSCDWTVRLTATGTIRQHGDGEGGTCPGSHRPPA